MKQDIDLSEGRLRRMYAQMGKQPMRFLLGISREKLDKKFKEYGIVLRKNKSLSL